MVLKMHVKEGFEELKKTTITDYNKFKEFYNEFMKNWNKAILTSIGLSSQNTPDTTPSDTTPPTPSGPKPSPPKTITTPPKPSQDEMNTYIDGLNTPYPYITAPLPELNSTNIQKVLPMIPEDATKFVNAIIWMNKSLSDALDSMNSVQGFEDKCDNLSNCLNDPAFLNKLAEAQRKNELDQAKNAEQIISNRIQKFFSNEQIVSEMTKNIELIKKADKLKTDLENGNMPDGKKVETKQNAPINTKPNDPSLPPMVNYFNQR